MKAVLDHVGIAVRDLEQALAFYRDGLGLEIEASEEVISQRVRAHFVPVGDAKLELLEATAADSPIANYLDKRGAGLHHITLRVDDLAAALGELAGRGVRLIDAEPRPGAEGALVAFIHPSSAHGVLVELKQAGRDALEHSAHGGRRGLGVTRHTVGGLELCALYDGWFRLDGGSMFGVVPRVAWSAKMPPDEHNRIRLAIRPLLVRGVRTMLIDAGLGDTRDAAFVERYGVDRSRHLDHALAEAGVSASEVDIVLASHLHVDHAGGFVRRDAAGRLRPRFPRARYVVRRGEWEDALSMQPRSRASYAAEALTPLADAGVLDMVDDDQTIMPGVRVRRTGGHTRHHQIVMIESNGHHAAYAADLIPTTAHVPDAWITGFDDFPIETLRAKQQLAQELIDRDVLVFLSHDPSHAAGRIVLRNGKRTFQPLQNGS